MLSIYKTHTQQTAPCDIEIHLYLQDTRSKRKGSRLSLTFRVKFVDALIFTPINWRQLTVNVTVNVNAACECLWMICMIFNCFDIWHPREHKLNWTTFNIFISQLETRILTAKLWQMNGSIGVIAACCRLYAQPTTTATTIATTIATTA